MAEEDVLYDYRTQQHHYLQPLWVLHFDPIKVGFIDRDFL